MLLLDSHRPGDAQIGALGIPHSWEIDRIIVERVRIPVIIAGGLGPDNVVDAIRAVHPETRPPCQLRLDNVASAARFLLGTFFAAERTPFGSRGFALPLQIFRLVGRRGNE